MATYVVSVMPFLGVFARTRHASDNDLHSQKLTLALIVVHADPLQSGIANTTSPSTLATPRVGQLLRHLACEERA